MAIEGKTPEREYQEFELCHFVLLCFKKLMKQKRKLTSKNLI